MKIAIIGGGASGMVTAYLLDKNGHHVTVFEKQPILGGHIRTLNKNVKPNQSDCDQILESGVLEFPLKFHNFLGLMKDLGVELEPVDIGSAIFLPNGDYFLSSVANQRNFTAIRRWIEYLKLNTLYANAAGLFLKTHFTQIQQLYNLPISQFCKTQCIRNYWLKLLIMYSYSMAFDLINDFPAQMAIPVLRDYIFTNWVRIKGGVYSYIEKILECFRGEVFLNVEVAAIFRKSDSVTIVLSDGQKYLFDKVVFATPPDQIIKLLSTPTNDEIKRFSGWQKNLATTVIHTDTSMYGNYGVKQSSEFDFFHTNNGWGYNAYLNQLCGISSSLQYSLAFNLDNLIAQDKIIHIQEHHTPLYTTESFMYRDEVIITNGENNTYYVGSYLGDGLHEGAITSAIRVAELMS